MSGEENVQLRSVCVKIGSGATPRGGKEAYKGGATTLIRSQNVYNHGFYRDGLVRIDDNQSFELRSVEVMPDDVLLNITGDSVARCCQVVEDVLPARVNQHVAIVRPQPEVLDARYLRYVLVSNEYQLRLLGMASAGATRPALTKSMIEELEIPLPPLPEQRRIAKILGDLDDRIELNRKMNETLEQMARALFKSWFVDFDPVRAKMEGRTPTGMDAATAALFPNRLVDSELGPIPEGWEVKALGEVIECVKGRSYRSEELAESTTALVTLKSFLRGGGYRPDGLKPFIGEYKSNQRVYPGDLVIALTDVTQAADVIGKPALIRSDKQFDTLVASLDVGIIRPTDEIVSRPFLYCLFMTESFQTHAYSHSTGTTVLHLGSSAVPSYVTVLPPALVSQKFDEMAGLMVRLIDENEIQSRTLSTLRDILLPKLVSGEVRVGKGVSKS